MAVDADKTPSYFDEAQRALLREVLNAIVPADGEFPAAGDLGMAAYINSAVEPSDELKRLFSDGLAQIQIESQAARSTDFATLSSNQKDTLLSRVESQNPAFFEALVKHTYNGYYTNPEIVRLTGMEVRPPQPLGYDIEPLNLGLLQDVKKYRRGAHRKA